ncbi:MFS transporter [Streptacidiphilus cavernicola]|uniref:MFS transporter n=1 Tax=Streptacidiphilus cavernicola TaxID=3342716 RepID=A0ABV6VSN5_9ACTN
MTSITPRHRNTALLVAGCFFMEMLDGTIVSTAAPQIGASLRTSPTSVGLVVTAYLLTLAVLIPLSGWLTARYGVRRIFLGAIALFTVASLGCALAGNLGELVALRVVQGVGGAMMVPVGRLVVLSRTEKQDIPRVMAYVVWPALIAPVLAPLLGGVITTYLSWHWLFLVNLPLGAAALATAWRLIEDEPLPASAPLDWAGVLLTCAGLGGLTWAGHLVSADGSGAGGASGTGGGSGSAATAAIAAAVAAASLLALAAAVRHLLRTAYPLLNLRTLKVTTFRAAVGAGSLFWVTVSAIPFLLPLLFQTVFGWSPVKSGAMVLFVFVGNIGIKPATTYLLNRFGFRPLLLTASLGLAGSAVACAFFTAGTPLPVIALVATVSGAARSLGLTCYSVITFSDVPGDLMRDANTLSATQQQTAAGLGVVAATVALRIGDSATGLLPGAAPAAVAYGTAFCLLALLVLGATAGALRLRPGAGDAVRRVPGRAPAKRPGPVSG